MPLPLPNLDDRRWADLVEEGRALIPLYAPEWTDHNVHDPGVTLIELFAFLTEQLIYRANRVPARNRLKFLALVGIAPEPPRPARAVLSIRLRKNPVPLQPAMDSVTLPASLEFEGDDPFGQRTLFRTLNQAVMAPGELRAIKYQDARGGHDLARRQQRGEPLAILGDEPQPGAALYLGLSAALPPHVPVSLHFTFDDPKAGAHERARLLDEAHSQHQDCPRLPVCGGEPEPDEVRKDVLPPHHSVVTLWEFWNAAGRWQPLEAARGQVRDDTRSFTLDGLVQINLPAAMGASDDALYYVRCRFVSGAYDAAPLVKSLVFNAVEVEQAVPVTTTLTVAKGAPVDGPIPAAGESGSFRLKLNERGEISELHFVDDLTQPHFRILRFQPATDRINGALAFEGAILGRGTGRPLQRLVLPQVPVVAETIRLASLEQDEWRQWESRRDFDAAGRADSAYTSEATDGVISFGDGDRGRVPPEGALLFAQFLTTRAEQGNLERLRLTRLSDNLHNRVLLSNFDDVKVQLAEITNPLAAVDGAASESLTHAEGRAIELMETPTRAVTLGDCETLAVQTPNVRVARVLARANLHPSFPCYQAPGLITLIVLPFLPVGRPMPSRGLLHAVKTYLARRRVIGSRIEVVGPQYREIVVRARIQAFAGINTADLRQRTVTALNRFFDPLTGGPGGTGWPFGRDVYRSEVMQVIDETEGVDHVVSLELLADGGQPQCANICLAPTELVAAGAHQIQIEGGGGCQS